MPSIMWKLCEKQYFDKELPKRPPCYIHYVIYVSTATPTGTEYIYNSIRRLLNVVKINGYQKLREFNVQTSVILHYSP